MALDEVSVDGEYTFDGHDVVVMEISCGAVMYGRDDGVNGYCDLHEFMRDADPIENPQSEIGNPNEVDNG